MAFILQTIVVVAVFAYFLSPSQRHRRINSEELERILKKK